MLKTLFKMEKSNSLNEEKNGSTAVPIRILDHLTTVKDRQQICLQNISCAYGAGNLCILSRVGPISER